MGYISSCPTNLGTALRASCHIDVPHLSKNKEKIDKIADKYEVAVRLIGSQEGVFDVSNKRRLGASEAELVQNIIYAINDMINAENLLNGSVTPTPVKQTQKKAAPKETSIPVKPAISAKPEIKPVITAKV